MANPYLSYLTKYGGTLGGVSGMVKPLTNNPIARNTVKALPFVSGGIDAYGDYGEGIRSGENGLRAGVGASLAGAADATFWTGARTLNPMLMAAGVGLDGLGWAADRAFETFDPNRGYDTTTPAGKAVLQQWKQNEATKARSEYNRNPTPETRQKAIAAQADADGNLSSLKADDAGTTHDSYMSVVKGLIDQGRADAKEANNPYSPNNQGWRTVAREDKDLDENRQYRLMNSAFGYDTAMRGFNQKNQMAQLNADAYWNRADHTASDIAKMASVKWW